MCLNEDYQKKKKKKNRDLFMLKCRDIFILKKKKGRKRTKKSESGLSEIKFNWASCIFKGKSGKSNINSV